MNKNICISWDILSPEHRKKIDIRLWLYIYIIGSCDSSKDGSFCSWDSKLAAKALGVTLTTVNRQLKQLELDGYIVIGHNQEAIKFLGVPHKSLKEDLLSLGVLPGPAKHIVDSYAEDYIREHINHYLAEKGKSPYLSVGWLVNNIKGRDDEK